MGTGNRPVCRNTAEIAAFIGVNKQMVRYLIKKHDLPAFKIEDKGNWKALKTSLIGWLSDLEAKFRK